MPLIYRAIFADADGKPLAGTSGKTLGVRLPPDPSADIPVQKDGTVLPQTGGMSVAPVRRDLPYFLIPRRLQKVFPLAGERPSPPLETGRRAISGGTARDGFGVPTRPGGSLPSWVGGAGSADAEQGLSDGTGNDSGRMDH